MTDKVSEKQGSKTTWWFQVNVNFIAFLVAVVVAGWLILDAVQEDGEQSVQDAARAKLEREQREQETKARNEERDRIRREEAEARRKEWKAKADATNARMAEERREREAKAEAQRLKWEERQAEAAQAYRKAQEEIEARLKAERQSVEPPTQPQFDLAAIKAQYRTTEQEIEQLQGKLGPLQAKAIAFRNKMEYALKKSETLRRQYEEMAGQQGVVVAQGGGSSLTFDMTEEMQKAIARNKGINKEFQDNANGYAAAIKEKSEAEAALADAKRRRDEIAAWLKQAGVDVTALAPATLVPVARAQTPNKIFVLKSGRKVVAALAIDGGDVWSVKTETGKLETIQKGDIAKVVEEEE